MGNLLNPIPSDRIIHIDSHQIYIIRSNFKLSPKRKLMETLCVLDLIRHSNENKCIFGPPIATVISEEAYSDALLMQSHATCPGSFIYQHLNTVPNSIRITSNAMRAYCPTSEFIYISFL
jgi:hypothetical protein